MRGSRLHVRLQDPKSLSCHHFSGTIPPAYICLPLSALGETLGILHISADNADLFTSGTPQPESSNWVNTPPCGLPILKLREKLHDQSIPGSTHHPLQTVVSFAGNHGAGGQTFCAPA